MELDFQTATMDQLDNLTIDDLLGASLSDVNLVSSLPNGVYVGYITKQDLQRRAAIPEENKKAALNYSLSIKVVKCLQCADSDVDANSLAGRVHFQRFPLHIADMGKPNLVKMVLGALGISYKDKAAIAEVGGSISALVGQFIESKVAFGFTIKNSDKGGYENCDIVFKQEAFIPADKVGEFLD